MEEFVFNIASEQPIVISVDIYVEADNSFEKVADVDEEPPLKIYIYENNHRITLQRELYFTGVIKFLGKRDSTYTIRFYNTGTSKLVQAGHNEIIQSHQEEKFLEGSAAQAHGEKARRLGTEFKGVFQDLHRQNALLYNNIRMANEHAGKYFAYEIVELGLCIATTLGQIHFIKKLLKGSTIL